MKKKALFPLMFLCCLTSMSLAKQSGKQCDYRHSSPASCQEAAKPAPAIVDKEKGFGQLPFRVFIFNI